VTGAPSFDAELSVDLGGAAAGLNVALYYSPPDAPEGYNGWLVTQGMTTIDHADAGGTRHVHIELDHRHISLRAGGTLRLITSNLAPNLVHHLPWVNPVMFPFALGALVGGGAAQPQPKLTIPVSASLAKLPEANTSAWEKGYWVE
jgi:hypothetical protein